MSSQRVLIAFPTDMLMEMDELAHDEFRTRSELIREAVRRYLQSKQKAQRRVDSYVPEQYESR